MKPGMEETNTQEKEWYCGTQSTKWRHTCYKQSQKPNISGRGPCIRTAVSNSCHQSRNSCRKSI